MSGPSTATAFCRLATLHHVKRGDPTDNYCSPGGGMRITPIPDPCGRQAPKDAPAPTKLNPQRRIEVRCNRPSGHEGDHTYSTVREAQVLRWASTGELVRG